MKDICKFIFGLDSGIYEKLSERSRHYYRMRVIALVFSLPLSAISACELGITAFELKGTLLAIWCICYICVVGLFDVLVMGEVVPSFVRMAYSIPLIALSSLSICMMITTKDIQTYQTARIGEAMDELRREYEMSKSSRYAMLRTLEEEQKRYHGKVCVPEANNKEAGPVYARKHAHCDNLKQRIGFEREALDAQEVQYLEAYKARVKELEASSSIGFFEKARLAIKLVFTDWIKAFMAVAVIVIGAVLEAVVFFASLKKRSQEVDVFETEVVRSSQLQGIEVIRLERERKASIAKFASGMSTMNEVLKLHRIFNENAGDRTGMSQLQKEAVDKAERAFSEMLDKCDFGGARSGGTIGIKELSSEMVFGCNGAMQTLADELWSSSGGSSEEYAKTVFDWCIDHLVYQSVHDKQHYKVARECFNARTGICGELSMVYIALLRNKGVSADYVHVGVDMSGREVKHACAVVNIGETEVLVDVAYRLYDVGHQEWERRSDEELIRNLIVWNK